ncbi:MAG TPA: 50S ribosomal protein L24 [Nitrospiraceae bacterium]|jgi:large subunit ribosomal protein L24
MRAKLKKGDTVIVIAGAERGKTGKVLSVHLMESTVVVEKLNMIKRHTKPNQKVRQGGILEREAPIAISNVMYYSANLQKRVRVGFKALENGQRVRITKKDQAVIE